MRPGQLTPENSAQDGHFDSEALPGFNEAGAINPGKPPGAPSLPELRSDASMRPGQLTPENEHVRHPDPDR